ncbi:hypothetical protein BHM03_00042465 [Ensete ventricosum]|nr:hypothetical protein BHM03_00042465 [Ensete ventricosum]
MINYDRERITIRCEPESSPGHRVGDDIVGIRRETHRKLAEGIESLPGVHREFAKGIEGLPRVCQKLAEGIGSLLGVRQELAEDNRELVRMASGVRWKKTNRLIGRLSGVAEKLVDSQDGLAGFDGHIIVIDYVVVSIGLSLSPT